MQTLRCVAPGMHGDITTAARMHSLLDLTQTYASDSTVSCRQPICHSFNRLSERLTEFSQLTTGLHPLCYSLPKVKVER